MTRASALSSDTRTIGFSLRFETSAATSPSRVSADRRAFVGARVVTQIANQCSGSCHEMAPEEAKPSQFATNNGVETPFHADCIKDDASNNGLFEGFGTRERKGI